VRSATCKALRRERAGFVGDTALWRERTGDGGSQVTLSSMCWQAVPDRHVAMVQPHVSQQSA
jgi:hypothetical protein